MTGLQIRLENLSRSFQSLHGESVEILSQLDARFKSGESIGLRGANGTGKTTLLNILARVGSPSAGTLATEPANFPVGYVQQDYTSSLLPWLTALGNVALPLRLRGMPASQAQGAARNMLHSLGFANLPVDNYPHQLSGGQRQRVAIARALVAEPALLLLDEPFANLDAPTSQELTKLLLAVAESSSFLLILVSHNLDDLILMSDRVLVLAGKPATFVKEFHIELTRPRTLAQIFTEEFIALKRSIMTFEATLA
jgi:ABC-type nitrate/sulfonate/bicarbonate transport system ATPase subunit